MTITQIVLASLNIIAAGVMLWFASQAAYAREHWVHRVRDYEQMRDGQATGDWLANLNQQQLQILRGKIVIDESVIAALKPEDRDKIRRELSRGSEAEGSKSDAAIRQEMAKLFWNTGQHARFEVGADGKKVFKEAVDDQAYQQQNPPMKLIQGNDLDTLARFIGPAGYTALIRQAILQQYPRLALDEREALNSVYDARRRLADLNSQITKTKAEVDLLTQRRDVEKGLLQQAQQENVERRREITRLQADVEEGMGALTVALGRQADKKRQLDEIQQQITKTIAEIDKLDAQLRSLGAERNKP